MHRAAGICGAGLNAILYDYIENAMRFVFAKRIKKCKHIKIWQEMRLLTEVVRD